MDAILTRLIQRGSPFELQDACIQGIPCKVFPKGPPTLNDIYRKAESLGEREYLVSGDTRLSFCATLTRASTLACVLQETFEINAGMRVALVMRNCPEWVIAFIAVTSMGATAVMIHAGSAVGDIEFALSCSDCALAVCDVEHAASIARTAFAGKLIVAGDPDSRPWQQDWRAMSTLLAQSSSNDANASYHRTNPLPDAEALIAFTSGTTGSPKGVILSHRNLVTGLMNMMLGGAFMSSRAVNRAPKAAVSNAAPCALMIAPLSHISGYAQLLLMLHIAGKIVLLPQRRLPNVMQLIASERVRSLAGATPAMLRELLQADRSQHDLSSLSSFNIHGAALHTGLIEALAVTFPQATINTGYGLTETCGSVCVAAGAELMHRPASSGSVLPSVAIKLVGEDGLEVQAGEIGEIFVRGAMTMQRYCGVAGQTSAALINGWFKTGDLGRIASDGCLYVIDRLKDTMLCGGKKISFIAVEHAAMSFPGVEEAAVLDSAFCADSGELWVAVIAPGGSRLNAGALQEHIYACVDVLEVRLRIAPCKIFPRTASGKINRKGLRQQVLTMLKAEACGTSHQVNSSITETITSVTT